MLIVVLGLNLLLALLCWWGIWQIGRVRRTLADVTQMLAWAESQAQRLRDFPEPMQQRQQRLQDLRRQYQRLLSVLQQTQQLFSLLGWIWLRSARYFQREALGGAPSEALASRPQRR